MPTAGRATSSTTTGCCAPIWPTSRPSHSTRTWSPASRRDGVWGPASRSRLRGRAARRKEQPRPLQPPIGVDADVRWTLGLAAVEVTDAAQQRELAERARYLDEPLGDRVRVRRCHARLNDDERLVEALGPNVL